MPNSTPSVAKSRAFPVPAPALVLGGVVSTEGGAVLAALLIPVAGIAGTVTLRVGFGAIGLLALRRPRLRRCLDTKILGLAAAVGALLVLHHLCFYVAIHRLPLGVAVTLEFAGPLAVALVGARHWSAVGWAVLAAAGVTAAAGISDPGAIGVTGVLFALAAGVCWAGYIVVFPVLASRTESREALPLATLCAAVLVAPFGVTVDHAGMFTWRSVLLGASIALLCDVLAYTLQADALARMPRSLFSILTSTEPAAGAILGLLALGQRITLTQWAGIVAVVIASVGATRAHRARGTAIYATDPRRLDDRGEWVLQAGRERGKPAGGQGAVDRAVVDREGAAHDRRHGDGAVSDDRLLFRGADREDAGLGRVDDRGKLQRAVHPEVRDRERPAL